MVPFPVRIYYESATYGSAISHRRSSVRARAPGLIRRLVCDIVRVAEPLSTRIGPQLICSPVHIWRTGYVSHHQGLTHLRACALRSGTPGRTYEQLLLLTSLQLLVGPEDVQGSMTKGHVPSH